MRQNREQSAPVVSVIMPAYNAERFIGDAIDSVLAQTFKDFELVVIDDGSTDRTAEIVKSHGDPRVVYRRLNRSGTSAAMNEGIASSRGRYLVRLDADDLVEPSLLARATAALEADPGLAHVSVDFEAFGDDSTLVQSYAFRVAPDAAAILRLLPKHNCILHSGSALRRDVFDQFSYDEQVAFGEDYLLWLKMAIAGRRFGKISEPLVRYRVHASSATHGTGNRERETKWLKVRALFKARPSGAGWLFCGRLLAAVTMDLLKSLTHRTFGLK